MSVAITRRISRGIVNCELTHQVRVPIDFARAEDQHRHYEACLVELGCELHRLEAQPDLPDSVFVEDAAVVLDELALITRPGAVSRRPETSSIARVLETHRPLARIEPPGTLEGGDVLRIGRRLLVGLSRRTNRSGLDQLRLHVEPHGYSVHGIEVRGCLHLKSAVTQVAPDLLLVNRAHLAAELPGSMHQIEVDPDEPMGANALLVGTTVVYPTAYPRTLRRLVSEGLEVRGLDVSELAKAEGGLTCCSLIFRRDPARDRGEGRGLTE